LRDLKKLLKETDYDLVPLYFSGRTLTTEKPVAVTPKQAATVKPSADVTVKTPKATGVAAGEKPAGKPNTSRAKQEPNPSKKKKHKNRHTKNKGMRKKWRDRDAQQ